MEKSVTMYEKPTPHSSLATWYAKQWEFQKTSDTLRADSFELRNSARMMRNETNIRTEWNSYLNNNRLADRITDVTRWKELMEKLLERVNIEHHLLLEEKNDVERELESINVPLQIIAQSISARDSKRTKELTCDEPEEVLKKELCVVENVKRLFTEKVHEAWEKLNRLESVRFKLTVDLEDKVHTLDIDKDCLLQDKKCTNGSYKPNALRNPKNSITYDSWVEQCRFLKKLADDELSDVHMLRETMRAMLHRGKNDMKAQEDFTNYALRKRIFETQKGRNEAEWQKLKVKQEMEALEKELARLEKAYLDKVNDFKCVETRLENRTYRPGFELCRDDAELGLKDEARQLYETKENLKEKMNAAKATYNRLEALLVRIEHDLEDKEHSIMTDVMSLDIRKALRDKEKTSKIGDFDRNIVLTRMEKEIPPEP